MLIKILINYIIGYVNITVEGFYIERFMNICISKSIFLWSIKKEKFTIMHANIGRKDFKKLKNICKKTNSSVKIESKKGLQFIFNKYKKRKIFAICFLIIMISIFTLSRFLWNIEIVDNTKIDKQEIIKTLKECGLEIGKPLRKIDTSKIISQIRLKNKEISWIGIQIEGTNAKVEIATSQEKPEIINPEDYCNIVADKSGIITKINAQNGTKLVNEGDRVETGTILVGGWLEGKYTGTKYVHSIATIQAKVYYSKKIKVNLKQEKLTQTGNCEKKYGIKINNFLINFYKTISKFEKYDTIDENKKVRVLKNFYLPIEIIKKTNYELKQESVTYTVQELAEETKKTLETELKQEIENIQNITDEQVNVTELEDSIEVEVIYEVLENIGTKEKIVF